MDAEALDGKGGDEDYSEVPHRRYPSKEPFLLHTPLHAFHLIPCPPEGKFLRKPFQDKPVNGYLGKIITHGQGDIIGQGEMVENGVYHGDCSPAGEMQRGKDQQVVSRGKEVFH